MRGTLLGFVLAALCTSLHGQAATPPPPQSARQALIEMLFGKGENDFQKHLPDDARRSLIHAGETQDASTVLRIAAFGKQMVAGGDHIQTFDDGSTILTYEESGGHDKTEILVEHDSLLGEDDEIELSVHVYKNGQPQTLPVVPQIIFTFRKEKEIWRLTELTAAAHIPLTDADYLKGLRKQQDEDNESTARYRIKSLVGSEANYAANHPDKGYACSLSGLTAPDTSPGQQNASGTDGSGNDSPDPASPQSNGYLFGISGCSGTPAAKYRITATPTDPDAQQKTFCADESGVVKSVAGEKPSSCFSRGEPAFPQQEAPVTVD